VTEPVPAFVDPVMHVVDGSVLFRQTARGNVVVGGHPRMSVDPTAQRTRVAPEKIATNLARLVAVAPHMRAHHVIRSWTGIEGYLPDMMPVLGPSDTTPGLFHACAFSGHGLQAGPAAASALAELIVDGATSMPIAPFAIGRFRTGEAAAVRTMKEEFQDDVLRQGGA
jgi:sarcosine oxidase, subunit beta